ncbi:MAG TPA: Holliday junction branch migration protein RuvA, partial [Polyangiaceae bacterium]|nr:Holliday junction branch migration protein RuvA [Polyangiaceae bacterium]
RKDLAALTSISGVGKKIAERLLLELRDKLPSGPAIPTTSATVPTAVSTDPGGEDDRLRAALTRMGFRPAEADRAIAALGERAQGTSLPDLLREALALLAK